MSHFSYTRGYRGIADVFLRDPGLYAPLVQFIERVMTRPSDLTVAEREMLAAHVSKLNGCGFCVGVHRATLAAMDEGTAALGVLDALWREDGIGDGTDDTPSRMLPLLRFAQKLNSAPERIGRTDVESLVAAGWSEQAVEDVVNVAALFALVNRLVDAMGIDADEAYAQQIGPVLARDGYAPFVDAVLGKAVG